MSNDPRAGAERKGRGSEICVFAPWPLFTITIEKAIDGRDEVYFHAGGQGVWVARMVANFGHKATLVAPFGGEAKPVIEALVKVERLGLRSVPIKGANGGYVNDRREGERKEIANVEPPRLDRHEIDDLYDAALAEGLRCGTLVLTGIPDGQVFPAEIYGRLAKDLTANGVAVVADIAGTALEAVEEGISLLKISHEEVQAAGLAANDSHASLVEAISGLREKADDIVVSCAGSGAIALLDGKLMEAASPQLVSLDHTGAGDSMTAALAVAKASGMDRSDALRLAMAAGAMNVTRHGRGTGNFSDILELSRKVEIREAKS